MGFLSGILGDEPDAYEPPSQSMLDSVSDLERSEIMHTYTLEKEKYAQLSIKEKMRMRGEYHATKVNHQLDQVAQSLVEHSEGVKLSGKIAGMIEQRRQERTALLSHLMKQSFDAEQRVSAASDMENKDAMFTRRTAE